MSDHKVYCSVRKSHVAATPEELVRQRLILFMTELKGYPIGTLAVEKELSLMPHIQSRAGLPDRRADIVCFGKGIHASYDLYPLLLVECKAVPLTKKVVTQVTGYNHYLQAYFVSLANDTDLITGWYDGSLRRYVFAKGLPSYDMLRSSAMTRSAPVSGSSDFQEL